MLFKEFPDVSYKFGNETSSTIFQNISAYVDIIDDIKDDVSFYQFYNIYDERPDQLSFKLYDDVSFYWTFFLLNDKLRKQGWPIREVDFDSWIKKTYDKAVVTTKDSLSNVFPVGASVQGLTSGASGTIVKRNEDLGQLFIESPISFVSGEIVFDNNNNTSITADTATLEYNAVKYYLDENGEITDIDPANGPGQLYTPVTYYDYLKDDLDNLRAIKVIKPQAMSSIVSAFKAALRS